MTVSLIAGVASCQLPISAYFSHTIYNRIWRQACPDREVQRARGHGMEDMSEEATLCLLVTGFLFLCLI